MKIKRQDHIWHTRDVSKKNVRRRALRCLSGSFLEIHRLLVPSVWKVAHMNSVFKKSDVLRRQLQAYLSYECRLELLENIVYSSLVNFLDVNDILSDFQHGFRNHSSFET